MASSRVLILSIGVLAVLSATQASAQTNPWYVPPPAEAPGAGQYPYSSNAPTYQQPQYQQPQYQPYQYQQPQYQQPVAPQYPAGGFGAGYVTGATSPSSQAPAPSYGGSLQDQRGYSRPGAAPDNRYQPYSNQAHSAPTQPPPSSSYAAPPPPSGPYGTSGYGYQGYQPQPRAAAPMPLGDYPPLGSDPTIDRDRSERRDQERPHQSSERARGGRLYERDSVSRDDDPPRSGVFAGPSTLTPYGSYGGGVLPPPYGGYGVTPFPWGPAW